MLFLDASALVKRYVAEDGSPQVVELMARDTAWCASALCLAEVHVTLCHLAFDERTLSRLAAAADADWQRFFVVPADELCLARAVEIGCAHAVPTLDAIHLAAAERIREPVTFFTFDERQRKAAEALALIVA